MSNLDEQIDEILANWENQITGTPKHWEKTSDRQAIDDECRQQLKALFEEETKLYRRMLEKLGTEKCKICTDYLIDDDMAICEHCNYGVHKWCTGFVYEGDGEYPAESAYAICKDCFKPKESKEVLQKGKS